MSSSASRGVCLRFAPSPSGQLHLGNARVALINFLFKLHKGGKLFLRVDDTDLQRSDASQVPNIMADLQSLGIVIDDQPIYQSKRLDRYQEVAAELLKRQIAYRCYCSSEELQAEDERARRAGKPPRYSGRCKRLSTSDIETLTKESPRQPVVRLNTDCFGPQPLRFRDRVAGDVSTPKGAFGDFILLRSNGVASFNFATAIDDMDYGITHIVRGNEHLPNSARQMLIWQALKYRSPYFAHLSLLVGDSGKPLAKREGDLSVREFLQRGYLAEALAHYLLWIGSPTVGEKPCKDLKELAVHFRWPKGGSTAHFEQKKLDYFNRRYLHELSARELLGRYELFGDTLSVARQRVLRYIELFQENFNTLLDVDGVHQMWPDKESPSYPFVAAQVSPHLGGDDFQRLCRELRQRLRDSQLDDEVAWRDLLESVATATGLPKRKFFKGLRIMLTGREHGPELHKILELISRDDLLQRLPH